MRPGFLLKMAVREVRTGWQRLLFFLLSIAVGVGALVGIASFSANLEGAIRREARTLMAADLELTSSQPFDAETRAAAAAWDDEGARAAELAEMPSMAARTDGSRTQLVELKALRGDYPFYGELVLEPARPLAELLADGGIVVEEALLLQLHVAVGERVKLGSRSFRVAGLLRREPDRVAAAFSLGPRVLMALGDVESAGLITVGSRVRHKLLLALPPQLDVAAVTTELDAALADERVQVRSFEAAQPTLRLFLARMRDFLRLATLVTLVLGGLGVAQSIRVFLQQKQDTVAILKVLGASTGEVTAVFVVQCLGLALLGSGLGLGLGALIQQVLPRVVGELLPVEIVGEFVPAAALEGLAVGVVTALLFCLLPLLAIRGVAPAQILRRELAAIPPVADRRARVLALIVLGGGLVGLAAWLAGSWWLGAIFVGGVAAALLVLGVASAAGLALLRRLPRARSLSVRQGLGNLTRPGSQAAAVMVSLGLGVAVIAQIQLVQSGLLARVADDAPADAPNFFFVGILPDQVEPFRALLAAQGALEGHRLVPIVQARLARVGGREVAEMQFASESEERSVTREFAITWQDALPPGNEVVAGTWWSPEAAGRESWVSVEESLARRLELEVGEELVFDIQGVRVATTVESVRAVDWGQLQTNFMFILTARALAGAPTSWAATARSRPGPEGRRALQAAVIAAMPNVTAIDAAEVIERVQALVDRIAGVIRFMAGASVLAGLVILAGSIAATRFRRVREAAIFKALGATRGVLLRSLAIEYAGLGLVAGTVGTVVGAGLAWAVLTLVLGIPWHAPIGVMLGLPVVTAGLTVLVGVGALLGVIAEKPLAVLRGE
ncbi:MAG: ABC transporter permease [Nannocystis sp.]|uniref:ABC transporter permease n=1 Tax=Nannocystis sp. TaxID=1962667 RepID=UPI00242697FB|nr:FtsX-like permease family protein [Nannocystis sp.]MBK9758332.1 ABC transporter permease [Nannocystis sp.]